MAKREEIKKRLDSIADEAYVYVHNDERVRYGILCVLCEIAEQLERLATDYEIANSMYDPEAK